MNKAKGVKIPVNQASASDREEVQMNCLFVGGPADGKVIDIANSDDPYVYTENPRPVLKLGEDPSE